MSAQDVANAAKGAGFTGDALVTAIAVGLAESNGDPNAHCLNCAGVSEDSRGLFQINLNAHPQYANVNLYDPLTNAQAAYAISSGGTNWNPWATYTGGQYKANLNEAQTLAGAPYSAPNNPPDTTASSNPGDGSTVAGLPISPKVAILAGLGLVAALIVLD